MKYYFKYLVYHALCVSDACVNLFCSIFSSYPKIDMAMSFLISQELSRVDKEIGYSVNRRLNKISEADRMVDEAKKLGEDIDG